MAVLTIDDQKLVNGINTIMGTEESDQISAVNLNNSVTINVEASSGDDSIVVHSGQFTIDGGSGNDSISFYYEEGTVANFIQRTFNPFSLNNYKNDNDTIYFETNIGEYTLQNIETIFYYQITAEPLSIITYEKTEISLENFDAINQQVDQLRTGTNGDDILYGGIANDTLNGLSGNDTLEGYEGNDTIDGGEGDDQIIGGDGNDTLIGGNGNDRIEGGLGEDTIHAGAGDDFIEAFTGDIADGGDGYDTAIIYALPKISESAYSHKNGEVKFNFGVFGDASYKNVEAFQLIELLDFGLYQESNFTVAELDAYYGLKTEALTGTLHDDVLINSGTHKTIYALTGNDTITGSSLSETIYAGDGNDQINHSDGSDKVDGGDGNDTYQLVLDYEYTPVDAVSINEIKNISKLKKGGYLLSTNSNQAELQNVENIGTFDIESNQTIFAIETYINQKPTQTATINGQITNLDKYTGAVEFLEFEFIGGQSNDVASGSLNNDFINLKEGDDAVDAGDGDDVLDGGTGSNFLTGGQGNDTFFLDGRGGEITWSTITDFNGDEVNIWGWNEGVSKLLTSEDGAGADGFKGATFHYDLNNDGTIDTSITFSGLTLSDVPQASANIIEQNGYLLFV